MKKLVVSVLSLVLAFGIGGSLGAGAIVPKAASYELSIMGNRAIDDLRRCLATKESLDVYYLIDMSGSLFSNRAGGPGTDPDFARSQILGESLRQLSQLATESGGDKAVRWNAGFFSDDFYPASKTWRVLDSDTVESEVEALDDAIRSNGGGATNWLSGILGAQQALAAQKQASNGCQILIWLTDGGLNVQNDDGLSFSAYNSLCGVQALTSGAQPQLGFGPLYELRQAGVVVFGVLLDVTSDGNVDTYQGRKTWLQPLVEGSGQAQLPAGTANLLCGDGSGRIPESHAAGAFIRAQELGDLAIQFLRLSGLIQGGSLGAVGADGSFSINPGVAKVELLSLSDSTALQLTDPAGQVVGSANPSIAVLDSVGASKITIEVDEKSDFGTWKLTGTNPSDVVLIAYSALSMVPEATNALISGQSSEVVVVAQVTDPTLFSVSDYMFDLEIFRQTVGGEYVSIGRAQSTSMVNGRLSLRITPDPSATQVNLRFEASNLRTAQGGTKLADQSSEQSLVVSLPTNFPTFGPIPLDLGLLQGRLTPATGTIEITAPASGEVGYFCFNPNSNFRVQSDSLNRDDSWNLSISSLSGGFDGSGCLEIGPGERQTVEVSLQNSQTANSLVTGFIDFTLKDASGAELEVTAPTQLETQRIINPFVLVILEIILIILALLLPLLAIYIVNKLSTKVEHGNELLKAGFPVLINLKTGQISAAHGPALTSGDIGLEQFKFQRPQDDAREIAIPEIGAAKAKVSLNPLVAPWFEIEAKPDTFVFNGKQTRKKGKRFRSGEAAEFSGQLSKTWAISVNKSNLASASSATEDLSGTLVVFARNAGGVSPNFQERMFGVLEEAKVSGSIIAASEYQASQAASKSKDKKKPPKAGPIDTKPPKAGSIGPGGPGLGGPKIGGPAAAGPKPTSGPAALPPPGPGAPGGPKIGGPAAPGKPTGIGGPGLPKPPAN